MALTVERIVDRARHLVADEGAERLTMRRLAEECDVPVMTLYGYVRNKAEILEALGHDAGPAAPEARRLAWERIIRTATDLVEREGVEALTMRRLAEECDMGAMSLYGYVRTKREILAAVSDRFLSRLELPAHGDGPWEEELHGIFRALHDLLADAPALAQIALSQPTQGANWARSAEAVLSLLSANGFGDEDSVAAADALVSFTVGFTLRQLSRERRGTAADGGPAAPGEETPTLEALGSTFDQRAGSHNFDAGLRMLIRGIAATRGQGP